MALLCPWNPRLVGRCRVGAGFALIARERHCSLTHDDGLSEAHSPNLRASRRVGASFSPQMKLFSAGCVVLLAWTLGASGCASHASSSAGVSGSAPCSLCDARELLCVGPALPESQSSLRTASSDRGCDYQPAPGFAGMFAHVECPSTVTCNGQPGCPEVTLSDKTFTLPDADGGVAVRCTFY